MGNARRQWGLRLALGTMVAMPLAASSAPAPDSAAETESPGEADAGAPSAAQAPAGPAAERAAPQDAPAAASPSTASPGAMGPVPGPPVAGGPAADEPGPKKALGYRVGRTGQVPSEASASRDEGTERRIRHELLWPGVAATVIGVPLTIFGGWLVSVSGGGSQTVNETGAGLLVPGIALLVVGVPLIIVGAIGEDEGADATAELLVGPGGLALRGSF